MEEIKKIRTILIDDEEAALADLKDALLPYQNIEIIRTCYHGKDGLAATNELRPDLVFVDIEMPYLNGFEMLSRLTHVPVIIFCTGFIEYALRGYEYDPADFINKPIDPKRFDLSIKKALRDIETHTMQARLEDQQKRAGYLWLEYRDFRGDSHKVQVYPPHIVLIKTEEGNPDYIEYHLTDGSHHAVKKSLRKALQELANPSFLRVNQSSIVNAEKIQSFSNYKELLLEGYPDPLLVSRLYKKGLRQYLKL